MLLFKYVGPESVLKVFEQNDRLAIRFGLPSSYNDPYELFVEPSPPLKAEDERAFYNYFLGKVVEAPVACFSRRPDSVVMWAHYGREGTGVCLGFDEDDFVDQFPIAYIHDVEYRDTPAAVDSGLVSHALRTGKRRHTLELIRVAHRAAYFTKRSDWQYEVERRVVVQQDAVTARKDILIGYVAPNALRFIIVGSKASTSVQNVCEERAELYGVPLLRFTTGTRTYEPYFVASGGEPQRWISEAFTTCREACCACGEPGIILETGACQWCEISDEAANSAPRRSLLTATLFYGIDQGVPFVFEDLRPRGRKVREFNETPSDSETERGGC